MYIKVKNMYFVDVRPKCTQNLLLLLCIEHKLLKNDRTCNM